MQNPNETPHIKSKAEGIRNVDVFMDFPDISTLNSYLDQCTLIGVGENAVIFLLPPPINCLTGDAIFRIELRNPVGYEWTKDLIESLILKYPKYSKKLNKLLLKIEWFVKPRKLSSLTNICKDRMRAQIAGHNSAFRRDPTITIPINSYFTFQNRWLGVRMRYLDGKPLSEAIPHATLSALYRFILRDENPDNVLVQIRNSAIETMLIDIEDFTASDTPINE